MSDRLEQKIDKIVETLGDQAVTLGKLTVSVQEHVRRSNQLESIVLPIQKKVGYAEGALKFIGFLAMLAAIAEVMVLWIKH